MRDRITEITKLEAVEPQTGEVVGLSREGMPVLAYNFGFGERRVSLLAGCHADEPVGPSLLRKVCNYLSQLSDDDPMLADYDWWIVPHINPDGEARNMSWQTEVVGSYDLGRYLLHRNRELPGDDIEFGFPRGSSDADARPEPRAVYDWWRRADGPFALHVSLHGMGFAAGPWFLIEAAWQDRCGLLEERCVGRVDQLGYTLHDVERRGEKGFFRLGRGFATRPDSRYMRQHFLDMGDRDTAALFRPSSMETIRSLGGDPLTLVSEMPLFITPGVGADLGPPDPVAAEWKDRIEQWVDQLKGGALTANYVDARARELGLSPMPIRDQMDLQWTFIIAGLEQVAAGNDDAAQA